MSGISRAATVFFLTVLTVLFTLFSQNASAEGSESYSNWAKHVLGTDLDAIIQFIDQQNPASTHRPTVCLELGKFLQNLNLLQNEAAEFYKGSAPEVDNQAGRLLSVLGKMISVSDTYCLSANEFAKRNQYSKELYVEPSDVVKLRSRILEIANYHYLVTTLLIPTTSEEISVSFRDSNVLSKGEVQFLRSQALASSMRKWSKKTNVIAED